MTGKGPVFIPGPRCTGSSGTNRERGSGWGQFRVGELVWWGKYKISGQVLSSYCVTDGSETSAFKNQTPGIHPKDYSQYSKHGKSLKSRIS
jgi:hypothetical protein